MFTDSGIKCKTLIGLKFCGELNGQSVELTRSSTQIEAGVQADFNGQIKNLNIIQNGNDTACRKALQSFKCREAFPLCGTAIGCQAACNTLITSCQINPTHASLFDCADPGRPDYCS